MKRFTKYPTNYVRANTINRYSDVVPYEKRRYWYFTTHGYGPGSLPRDVAILETREGQNKKGTWGDFICLDSVLNTSELRQYDLIELAPEDVKSACGEKVTASQTYTVDVGGVETYQIEADTEEEALQTFLNEYAQPEDIEEYEDDPSYLWVYTNESEV